MFDSAGWTGFPFERRALLSLWDSTQWVIARAKMTDLQDCLSDWISKCQRIA